MLRRVCLVVRTLHHRPVLLGLALAAFLLATISDRPALGAYPTKPIQLVVAFAPGGSSDQVSRLLADYVGRKWGKPVTVVNKPGGGGAVGNAAVAQAAPDGYTLANAQINTQAFIPAAQVKAPYNWDSFTYICRIGVTPSVLTVKGDSPYKTAKELIEAIKKNPDKFKSGVSGLTGTGAFGIGQLLSSAGVDPTKVDMVSFDGGSLVITNLAGGHVDFVAQQLPEVLEMVKAGRLRALAQTNSERVKELPDVPTSKEAGFPAYDVMPAGGLVGPPNLPQEVVSKWEEVVTEALKDKAFASALERTGTIPAYQNSRQYRDWTEQQYKVARDLAEKLKIRK